MTRTSTTFFQIALFSIISRLVAHAHGAGVDFADGRPSPVHQGSNRLDNGEDNALGNLGNDKGLGGAPIHRSARLFLSPPLASPNYLRQSRSKPGVLEKRQTNICNEDCSVNCYGDNAGRATPTNADCSALADQLAGSSASSVLAGNGGSITKKLGTCMFTFVNQDSNQVIWCESHWGVKAKEMVSRCVPSHQGASCDSSGSSGYRLDIAADPNYSVPTTAATTSAAPTTSKEATTQSSAQGAASSSSSLITSTSTPASGSGASSAISNSGSLGSSTSTSGQTAPGLGFTASHGPGETQGVGTVGDSGAGTSKGPGTSTVVGATLGGLTLVALILAFIFWRRRKRRVYVKRGVKREAYELEEDPEDPFSSNAWIKPQGPLLKDSTGAPIMPVGRVLPSGPWPTSSKAALVRQQLRSPGAQVPIEMTRNIPTHPSHRQQAGRDHIQGRPSMNEESAIDSTPMSSVHELHDPPAAAIAAPEIPTTNGEQRRSMSALTLAQAIAPNLSQTDIHRLADSIVARMHTGIPPVPLGHHRQSSGVALEHDGAREFASTSNINSDSVGSEIVVDDPPPPFRASWNSDHVGRHASQGVYSGVEFRTPSMAATPAASPTRARGMEDVDEEGE